MSAAIISSGRRAAITFIQSSSRLIYSSRQVSCLASTSLPLQNDEKTNNQGYYPPVLRRQYGNHLSQIPRQCTHNIHHARLFHATSLVNLAEKEEDNKPDRKEEEATQNETEASESKETREPAAEAVEVESKQEEKAEPDVVPAQADAPLESPAAEEAPSTTEADSSVDGDGDDTPDPTEVTYAFTEPPPLSEESQKRIDAIFEKILWLDMIEVHLLTQVVNENLGISWQETEQRLHGGGGGGRVAKAADAGAAEEPAEAKTIFDLKLVGFDAKAKIKVIKEVRTIAGLGLKEAKELVESAPKVIQKDLKQETAEELKAQLEAVGAEIELA